MDIRQLAIEITVFLTPFLPYLIQSGEATAKEIGRELGQALSEKAKFVWSKITNSTKNDPKLMGVAFALADDPDDSESQIALAKMLFKHLISSPELAYQLNTILKEDVAIQKVLVEQGSSVKDIHQRLKTTGRQEIRIRRSRTGDITQEQ